MFVLVAFVCLVLLLLFAFVFFLSVCVFLVLCVFAGLFCLFLLVWLRLTVCLCVCLLCILYVFVPFHCRVLFVLCCFLVLPLVGCCAVRWLCSSGSLGLSKVSQSKPLAPVPSRNSSGVAGHEHGETKLGWSARFHGYTWRFLDIPLDFKCFLHFSWSYHIQQCKLNF